MLRSSSSRYVCWRCLARRSTVSSSPIARQTQSNGFAAVHGRTLSASPRHQRGLATVHHENKSSDVDGEFLADASLRPYPTRGRQDIREQLRQWERDNPAFPSVSIHDTGSVVKPSLPDPETIEIASDHQKRQMQLDEDGFVDLRADSVGLSAGDLVELNADTWRLPIFAVCLGNLYGFDHFYTEAGKYFAGRGIRSLFVVKGFIQDPGELQPLVDELPLMSDSMTLDELREIKVGPTREAGANVIRQIHRFQQKARLTYQKHVDKLVHAHSYLGPQEKVMSLGEIAVSLLPSGLKAGTGAYSTETLYAIHMALSRDHVGFRPLSHGRGQLSYMYEIAPKADVDIVQEIDERLRQFFEELSTSRRGPTDHYLDKHQIGRFILKARRVVDQSRQHRAWTPHGMLGPSTGKVASKQDDPQPWLPFERKIIAFMHIWAAADRFPRGSRLNWVGSGLLRLLDRYAESTFLDHTVGWTFLQEIGWIKPWDIQSRYNLRLPGSQPDRRGSVTTEVKQNLGKDITPLLGPDRWAGSRREFGPSTVYCIDGESTVDVDDGISLEKDPKGDYWVHVHVANPTSRITSDSPLARCAQLIPQTIYLAGHHQPMLEFDGIREAFSLGPNKPSLTFSAKVNEQGDLLDFTITPGTVRNVVYITPEHVAEVLGRDESLPPTPDNVFAVGNPPAVKQAQARARDLKKPADLSQEQLEELHVLDRLAKALHKKRLANGAMPYYLPRPKVDVSFDHTDTRENIEGFFRCAGDPYIRISHDSNNGLLVVSSIMQLAGEVAARWCHARDIPIPYRVQPKALANKAAVKAFTEEVFYPQLVKGKRPPEEEYRRLIQLVGTTDTSTYPSPNYIMGMDFYSKATSPLRRFLDMVVHWQIEAALAEEARTGRSLVDNQPTLTEPRRELVLPFTRDRLENSIFPLLRLRERHGRWLDNFHGPVEWMLQALVRAWKYGEGSEGTKLPASFRFTATDVLPKRLVAGTLDWFGQDAAIRPEALSGVALMADIKPGDEFEVELADVNVYRKEIWVKALRRI